jgi:hypothetical protein
MVKEEGARVKMMSSLGDQTASKSPLAPPGIVWQSSSELLAFQIVRSCSEGFGKHAKNFPDGLKLDVMNLHYYIAERKEETEDQRSLLLVSRPTNTTSVLPRARIPNSRSFLVQVLAARYSVH